MSRSIFSTISRTVLFDAAEVLEALAARRVEEDPIDAPGAAAEVSPRVTSQFSMLISTGGAGWRGALVR